MLKVLSVAYQDINSLCGCQGNVQLPLILLPLLLDHTQPNTKQVNLCLVFIHFTSLRMQNADLTNSWEQHFWFWIQISPEGGAGQLLLARLHRVPQPVHLRLQHLVLLHALSDEVLQTLGHLQLPLSHLLHPKTELGQLFCMLLLQNPKATQYNLLVLCLCQSRTNVVIKRTHTRSNESSCSYSLFCISQCSFLWFCLIQGTGLGVGLRLTPWKKRTSCLGHDLVIYMENRMVNVFI